MKEKSATKVAQQLGLSQQAVSAHIKHLREALKHELFVRHSNGLQPTAAAYEISARVQTILHEVDRLDDYKLFDASAQNRRLHVIANEYAQLAILPRLFKRLTQVAKNLTLEVSDFVQSTHEELLASGAADLVLGLDSSIDKRLYRKSLCSDSYVGVVASGSAIAAKVEKVADLSKYPHVGFKDGESHSEGVVEDWLREVGVQRNVAAVLSCYTSLENFLRYNDAIAFIPSSVAQSGPYASLKVETRTSSFEVMVGWHKRAADSPFHNWLMDALEIFETDRLK